ncbi:Threonine/homoserine/homoserine lactone efflux protein [Streptoalloteichus tenebrarius]|uniref:Threonine/homoserine/homoserine lactone efflux protein n=1 Tax=Streptoalloteichus tenebrarius (strain ATCC 17920 / DSM 40477 / JCM 4838 / CBS 697.72 / NBRC 16177 / NCIMB 11028 / NRRL B-12390 / A12253. 1 / ISP 5477) TaxID=1933 RepID=A0ABT1HYI5_STRSD|nr:LysE family translocator [Streptoalloteichus tenebrarius]MCP2260591.1 Threonine/homoserine/homoserine lactone efflux protein [Streptoalloteichus tenebrarius]
MLSGLPTFLVAAFLVAITPGPATMLLIRQSAVGSWRTVLATIAGIEAGVLFWALAAVFGLSAVLVASQFAYDVLRVVGALVLVWFGAQALLAARRRPEGDVAVEVAPVPDRPWRAFHMALLTNATNPKAGVFAISFLPQFAPAGLPTTVGLLLCAGLWVAVDLTWYLGFGAALGRMGRWLRRATVRRRLEQVSGTVLIGLGLRLALDSR